MERRDVKLERFLGVTMMVSIRPLRANWWVKSKMGSMWPCAGNGNIRMCGFLMFVLDMAFTRIGW